MTPAAETPTRAVPAGPRRLPPWWRAWRLTRLLGGVAGAVLFCGAAAWAAVRPSNGRDWLPDQRVLARAEIDGRRITIRNVRDFRYAADGSPRAGYYDRTYDLDALETVWFVVAPFSRDWRGPAHVFLSFGFRDSSYVSISVEARRERGEPYSLWAGLWKRYELMYVIGDERDLIGLRANHRDDDVYVYPIRTTTAKAQALFADMVARADQLADAPAFYHTLLRNCTTTILEHVNRVAERRIRYGPTILLPGYADRTAHARGLIDTELPLDQARERFHVNPRARRWADAADFSTRIRAP